MYLPYLNLLKYGNLDVSVNLVFLTMVKLAYADLFVMGLKLISFLSLISIKNRLKSRFSSVTLRLKSVLNCSYFDEMNKSKYIQMSEATNR